jgi:hypothetical protein
MLVPAQSITAGRDDQTVYYDFAPEAVTAMLARLTLARNPYGPLPPASIPVDELVDMEVTPAAVSELHAALLQAASKRVTVTDIMAIGIDNVMKLANYFSYAEIIPLAKGFIFTGGGMGAPPATILAPPPRQRAGGPRLPGALQNRRQRGGRR